MPPFATPDTVLVNDRVELDDLRLLHEPITLLPLSVRVTVQSVMLTVPGFPLIVTVHFAESDEGNVIDKSAELVSLYLGCIPSADTFSEKHMSRLHVSRIDKSFLILIQILLFY